MIIVMIINLYMVRLILNALGVEDYGIYNVVAGVITMLQCITNVLSTSTQRFYSFSIGENNTKNLIKIFSASVNIYIIFSIITLIIGETLGLWILNTQLNIPRGRFIAAIIIYQFSIASFIFSILSVPFSAATIAHEDMNLFAIISIIDCILKLFLSISLFYISYDRLIYYGIMLFIITLFDFICYFIVGKKKYSECNYTRKIDRNLYHELLSFSGWSLFGSTASIGMNQVCTLFTNIFFGPITNASRAIAFQISSAINAFSANFLMAIRPPMIKAYAEESYLFLNKLFNISNKIIYYCMLIFLLPLMFEMKTILHLWLKIEGSETILFSRLILIYALIMALNNPISIIIQATGNVKQYHISVETFTLLCMPITYILFKLGYSAYTTFIVMIMAAILSHIVRIICLKIYYKPFNIIDYLKFIFQAFINTIALGSIIYFIHTTILNTFLRFTIIALVSLLFTCVVSFYIVLNKEEKEVLLRLLKK